MERMFEIVNKYETREEEKTKCLKFSDAKIKNRSPKVQVQGRKKLNRNKKRCQTEWKGHRHTHTGFC